MCVFVCVIRFKCARHKSPEQFQGNRKQYCSVQQLHARINYFGIVSAIFFQCVFSFCFKNNFFSLYNSKHTNIRIPSARRHRIFEEKWFRAHKSTALNSTEKWLDTSENPSVRMATFYILIHFHLIDTLFCCSCFLFVRFDDPLLIIINTIICLFVFCFKTKKHYFWLCISQ